MRLEIFKFLKRMTGNYPDFYFISYKIIQELMNYPHRNSQSHDIGTRQYRFPTQLPKPRIPIL
jgi:hypothetical protein